MCSCEAVAFRRPHESATKAARPQRRGRREAQRSATAPPAASRGVAEGLPAPASLGSPPGSLAAGRARRAGHGQRSPRLPQPSGSSRTVAHPALGSSPPRTIIAVAAKRCAPPPSLRALRALAARRPEEPPPSSAKCAPPAGLALQPGCRCRDRGVCASPYSGRLVRLTPRAGEGDLQPAAGRRGATSAPSLPPAGTSTPVRALPSSSGPSPACHSPVLHKHSPAPSPYTPSPRRRRGRAAAGGASSSGLVFPSFRPRFLPPALLPRPASRQLHYLCPALRGSWQRSLPGRLSVGPPSRQPRSSLMRGAEQPAEAQGRPRSRRSRCCKSVPADLLQRRPRSGGSGAGGGPACRAAGSELPPAWDRRCLGTRWLQRR